MSETPLESVPGWSAAHVARMGASWITTAEQVVALSATDGGVSSLAAQLEVPEDVVERMVDSARARLAPTVRAEMEHPVDTSEYGLGVHRPGGAADRR
jgi:hypothetical protein